MGSEWFPFHYRDAAGWRAEGLPLTCASDKAAKYLDAVVAQLAMFGTDEQLGGLEGALSKAKEEEPNMFLLKVIDCSFQVSGKCSNKLLYFPIHFLPV